MRLARASLTRATGATSPASGRGERPASTSLLLFRHLHGNLHWSTLESLVAAALPLAAAVTYVLTLKQGKPPHFDGELFEWLGFRAREAAAEALRLPLRSFLHPARSRKPHPLKPQGTAAGEGGAK